jgi:glycosyltransferase involved in cell wall biosynthesis
MKKKIIITTNHPAPYIDKWIEVLGQKYEVNIFYMHRSVKEKDWKEYNNTNGFDSSEYSLLKKFRILKKSDLVIFGGWNKLENVILCVLLFPFKTKTVIFLDHPIVGKTKTDFFSRCYKKIVISLIDFLFPACESCRNYLHATYGIDKKNMIVFPYAHSKSSSDISLINKNRETKLLNGDKIHLFIANRFIERKGYGVLLNAFNNLQVKGLLHFLKIKIAGAGEELSKYKKEFEILDAEIELLGWVENEQYEKLMDQCDVYLHASLFEPFGIPPLDAMQRGKSLIVSDGVKSMMDLEITSKKIHIYSANNSMRLSNCLKYVIDDKEKLYDGYEEIIDFVNEKYSPQRIINAVDFIIG